MNHVVNNVPLLPVVVGVSWYVHHGPGVLQWLPAQYDLIEPHLSVSPRHGEANGEDGVDDGGLHTDRGLSDCKYKVNGINKRCFN